jgi:hypothetical protein
VDEAIVVIIIIIIITTKLIVAAITLINTIAIQMKTIQNQI